ncbi:hypothetical protein [Agromyces sp. ZXT2-3]|uniref:hypothetical protein n=1 Tax=Agromyces sp. ZXT2-3 TaxID=3461152 RepID=UPI0040552A82
MTTYPERNTDDGGAIRLTDGEMRNTPFFNSEFTVHQDLRVPYLLQITADPPATDLSLELSYDGALFELNDELVALSGSEVVRAPLAITSDETGRDGLGTAKLPFDESWTTLTLLLPLMRKKLYPGENVGDAYPVSMTMTANTGATAETIWEPVVTEANTAPWGLVLSPSWRSVEGGSEKTDYRYTSALRCLSVGPGAVPAGTSIAIHGDRRILKSMAVSTVAVDGVVQEDAFSTREAAADGSRSIALVTLNNDVPSGANLDVELVIDSIPLPITPDGLQFAGARVIPPPLDLSRPQRITGAEAVRDLTTSGQPRTAPTLKQSNARK